MDVTADRHCCVRTRRAGGARSVPESGQGVTVAACRLALFLLGAVTRDLSRGVFRARPDLHGEVEERNKYISFPVLVLSGG